MELLALIEACKQGKREAQKMFFMQYYGKVLKTCKRYSKDNDEAKDLAQESMIRIFEQMHTIKNADSLNGWVQKVAANNCLNELRKQKNIFSPLEDYHTDSADINEEPTETYHPEQVLEYMQKLPVGYRTVLNLYAFENLTHKQIAQELNISEGTSKSQLNKARLLLKKILTKQPLNINQYGQEK